MHHYITVFDFARSGFRTEYLSRQAFIFAVIGALLVFAPGAVKKTIKYRAGDRFYKYFSWAFFILSMLYVAMTYDETYSEYAYMRKALKLESFKLLEGPVADFHPMPYAGHDMESFTVNGVRFSYSDYVVTNGFNKTSSHGGPIRLGLYVRIAYVEIPSVGNAIMKLEIAK